jgi:hypothetical protein
MKKDLKIIYKNLYENHFSRWFMFAQKMLKYEKNSSICNFINNDLFDDNLVKLINKYLH